MSCDEHGSPLDSGPQLSEPSLLPVAGAAIRSGDGESMSQKLEQFCKAGRSLPSFEMERSSHMVHFCTRTEMQKWLSLGYVDFAELFRGYGKATIRVREAGCTAS